MPDDTGLTRDSCCVTCTYWDQAKDGGHDGLCRRRAPSDGGWDASAWPVTMAHDWCGEYLVARGRRRR